MADAEPLACRILRTLAQEPAGADGMALARLGKRLGQSASSLLRELTYLSDAELAGQAGPGWVRVLQQDGRWRVCLTAAGLEVARQLAQG